ncbi:MAG: hypothetical protein ACW97Z_12100 [Candidatus Hodarchaeales archaeon]|jgi:hypothetical protein
MTAENKTKETEIRNQDILYNGLSYIKNQRNYLVINAIIPIYCIIVQAFNLFFTFSFILRVEEIVPEIRKPRTTLFLVDALTPSLLLLLFSIFAITNFIFLLHWRKKVHQYDNQQQDASREKNNITLTQLFYETIDIMEKLKKIFFVINVLFVFYLQWFFRFFLSEILRRIVTPPTGLHSFHSVGMSWLNLILQLLLLIYLMLNWRHFYRWNKKLTKLKDFEREIYQELDLEDGLLLVYGDHLDLEEAKLLLLSKKLNLVMKHVRILDNEDFELRFAKFLKQMTSDSLYLEEDK